MIRSKKTASAVPIVFSSLLFLIVSSNAWAVVRPAILLTQGIRSDIRSKSVVSGESIERFELEWTLLRDWRFAPFLETRYNFDDSVWSRIELGGEIGVKPFGRWSPPFNWFYVGNGLHQAWVKPGNDHPEWEIRTLFDIPLPWRLAAKPLRLYALSEYTYDLNIGQGIRNEVAAGMRIPLPIRRFDPVLSLGWRHVDIIHDEDEDQFEGSLQIRF